MASSDPPFRTIAIVGLGLIGGSMALATRSRWPSSRLIGVDAAAVLAHALGSDAIDRGVEDIRDLADADLIVLAAPVQQNVRLLQELSEGVLARRGASSDTFPIVTDVGGTKRAIVEAAQRLPRPMTFVGGHPLGGSERGGFAFAQADLFIGRPWILTPGPNTSEASIDRLSRFVTGLGARPTQLDAARHDELMAFLSHLPQLAATALMGAIGEASGDGLRLAGRGLVDTTRLASSPANVWRDICATNADAIEHALDALIARLAEMRASLRDGQALDRLFEEAARWRSDLMKERE